MTSEDERTKIIQDIKNENEIHNNQRRMIDINSFYSDKYRIYGNLMLKIIFLISPLLLICILLKYDIIPKNLGQLLMSIIIGVSGFFIIFDIIKISHRDNMDINAYDWQYDIKNIKNISDDNNEDEGLGFGHCIDSTCCDLETQYYDTLTSKCKTKSIESFIPQRAGRIEKNESDNNDIVPSNEFLDNNNYINNE